MAGNSFAQRRTRMRRPPVCISKDKEDKFPPSVEIIMHWTVFLDGMEQSTFLGSVIAFRIPGTAQYTSAFVDGEGHTCTLIFSMALAPAQTHISITIHWSQIPPKFLHGDNVGWDGTRGMPPANQVLDETDTPGVGEWTYLVP